LTPALIAWDDPPSILGRMSMKVAAILLLACFGGVVGHANAGLVATDEDPPGTPTIADDSQPADNDVAERLETMRERFGDYRSEAFKQSMADAAARQAALYPTQLAGAKPPKGVPQWRSTGPVSAKYQTNGVTLEVFDSGRVRRVLQDPAAPDTVYVLTAGGGVWKSTAFSHDNPRWKPLTDAVLDTSGGNMAMGRAQGTLYVGLGDPFDGIPTLSGGMIKTADGGDTWSAFVSLPNSATVQDVAVDTSTGADIVIVATDVGLFRSANAGGSYSNVLPGYFWSLVRSNRGWLASSDDGKLYLSHDRGATWLQVLSFGVGASSVGRTTLGVGAPGDAIVYAFAATPGDDAQRDLFVSNTGGLSWIPLGLGGKTPTNPNIFQPDMNIMGGQAFYNQMLLVDSSDATRKTVYIGGQLATAKTTDGGATWTLISDWLPGIFSNLPYVHADQHAATMIDLAGRPGIVFGTDGGIFVSSDGGASFDFTKNKGLDTQLAQTVMSSSMNPQTFGLGMQDTGTRVRMGSSGFFNQVTGGDGEGVGWSQANNAVTLTSAAFGEVFHSPGLLPDTFGSWTRVTAPLVAGDNRLFYTKIATPSAVADPTGLIFLTASAQRLYVVFDGAPRSSSWIVLARAGSKLPANFVIRETHHGIALDPNADFNRVAIVGTSGRVAFTLDGGLTWTTQTLIGLVPGFQGFNSAIAFTVSGAMYVVSESPIPGSVRVLKSIDNGATWVAAANGLPDVPIGDVREDPRDPSGQSLYVATGLGVYRTSDGGTTWSLFGAGLPTVRTSGLWVSADGRTVRVATYGRGAWEISP
jgi:hypothetical protein